MNETIIIFMLKSSTLAERQDFGIQIDGSAGEPGLSSQVLSPQSNPGDVKVTFWPLMTLSLPYLINDGSW